MKKEIMWPSYIVVRCMHDEVASLCIRKLQEEFNILSLCMGSKRKILKEQLLKFIFLLVWLYHIVNSNNILIIAEHTKQNLELRTTMLLLEIFHAKTIIRKS